MESAFSFVRTMSPSYTSLAIVDSDSFLDADHREKQCMKQINLLKKLLWLITGLFILIVVAVAFLAFQTISSEFPGKALRYRSPVPEIPDTTVYFRKTSEYSDKPSPISDEAWKNLLPPGRGYVYVEDSERYFSEPGETTPWGEIYSVALFHQLHCLGMIRSHYWMLMDGALKEDKNLRALAIKLESSHHINHCYDYIRQSLQCSGDMTLEWPRLEPDGRRFAVDGWNIPHRCKSWESIMEYMDYAHYNGSQRTDIG